MSALVDRLALFILADLDQQDEPAPNHVLDDLGAPGDLIGLGGVEGQLGIASPDVQDSDFAFHGCAPTRLALTPRLSAGSVMISTPLRWGGAPHFSCTVDRQFMCSGGMFIARQIASSMRR